ncbi:MULTISPECIES: hypothetical protein [Marinilactibacillus]|uniref:GIY-YIG domain-containing protein n=2 Tax=Marinilactibacillus TaxID=191769 RepID=A0AAV3WS09_9LACT|nr:MULTISPECIES: hypothetical protein [Marinilactibacillus]GEL66457.1 hypothetical protein MPS01_06120 [Marinilactibacillus psychrotolerans]GEQ35273.1 hypothetical protein M132T_07810 [Marinilactibacillus psychrotolerans]SDC54373.1 hypothetical protein SAMN04488013_10687 [Marinilactibacillus psychrotolerans]SFK20005.1 hypothetical protein SAMN04488569_101516 [Marinilactibacillus piezotolerans]
MKAFTQEVIDHLQYYVYALVNPDDKTIFYIGKGRRQIRYNFADSGIAINEINGIELFPKHIKFTGYHFVDDSGNPKRVQSPFTYIGF